LHLTIEKLIYGGDGLSRLPADEHGRGKAVFVPFVLPGEQVDASITEEKPGFTRARADQIAQASPRRISPQCQYFLRCGGCHYQHTDYDHQLEIKASILKENLRRIAKLELSHGLKIHPSPPWNYRNRTRLRLQTSPEFALGYYQFNSHKFLPVDQCPISSPLINRAIAALTTTGRDQEPGVLQAIQEIEFFANADDTQLLVEAYAAPQTAAAQAEQLAHALHSALPDSVGVVVFEPGKTEPKPIAWASSGKLTYQTARAAYRVSGGAFFQTNRHLTDELVNIVTEGRSGRTALDLYAGVGLFSSVLSREFERVIAVESSPISHSDLLYNSPENVKAVGSMSEQYLRNVGRKLQPDLVVVDPPRSGLGESVVHALVNLGAPRLTYVSCDPATLSRDLGRLLKSGYHVERAHLVDLFPQTYHLESVFHLAR
jgi:23S rRNA (uracil1939-C5)-methyltransferase